MESGMNQSKITSFSIFSCFAFFGISVLIIIGFLIFKDINTPKEFDLDDIIKEQIKDEKGKLLYAKFYNGEEIWNEWDEKGNLIHNKNSNGHETWHEYDSNGHLVHERDNTGKKTWYVYDANGKFVSGKDNYSVREIIAIFYYKASPNDPVGKEWYREGDVLHNKWNDGYECWIKEEWYGKAIQYKNNEGLEASWEYSSVISSNQLVHYKDNKGKEIWWDIDGKPIEKIQPSKVSDKFQPFAIDDYDKNRNLIYQQRHDDECYWIRDESGKVIQYKAIRKDVWFVEIFYDSQGNVIKYEGGSARFNNHNDKRNS